ncbi:hypothetical protein Tco_0574115 [Tanacetum coccineum]
MRVENPLDTYSQPKIRPLYPRESPFDLEAFLDSDCAGASPLDRKSTIRDETVYKEWEDIMERAATTASSSSLQSGQCSGPRCQDTILGGGVDAQTRIETTSKQSNDPPLSRGYTLGSGEDSMKLLELMELCTKMSDLVSKKKREMFFGNCFASTLRNGNMEITSTMMGKVKVVSEASIRRHLKLEDSDGISTLPNAEIFEQLALMGTYIAPTLTHKLFSNMRRASKGYTGVNTPLFQPMLVQGQNVQGEGSTIPVESHHTPTSAPLLQPPTSSHLCNDTHVLQCHDSPIPRVL